MPKNIEQRGYEDGYAGRAVDRHYKNNEDYLYGYDEGMEDREAELEIDELEEAWNDSEYLEEYEW